MAHRPDTPPTLTWQHMDELQAMPFDPDRPPHPIDNPEPVIIYSPIGGVEVLSELTDWMADDPDCLPLWWRTEADDMLLAARKALPKTSKAQDKTLRQRIVKTMNEALAEPFMHGLMNEGTSTQTPRLKMVWPKRTRSPKPPAYQPLMQRQPLPSDHLAPVHPLTAPRSVEASPETPDPSHAEIVAHDDVEEMSA